MRKKRIVTASETLKRVKVHPLIEMVTPQTYVVKGGWANGFVFLPDPELNVCVIIDPGVTKEFEIKFYEMHMKKFRNACTKVDFHEPQRILEALQQKHSRIKFIREVMTASAAAKQDASIDLTDLFFKRVDEWMEIGGAELLAVAICATHHHIDHLGVGGLLGSSVGRQIRIPNPNVFARADDKNSMYPVLQFSWMFAKLASGQYVEMEVIDISGHTEMRGFLLPDGTLIVGDLLGSEAMWKRSVLYVEDAEQHLKALRKVRRMDFERLVLSHGSELPRAKARGVLVV